VIPKRNSCASRIRIRPLIRGVIGITGVECPTLYIINLLTGIMLPTPVPETIYIL